MCELASQTNERQSFRGRNKKAVSNWHKTAQVKKKEELYMLKVINPFYTLC